MGIYTLKHHFPPPISITAPPDRCQDKRIDAVKIVIFMYNLLKLLYLMNKRRFHEDILSLHERRRPDRQMGAMRGNR